MVAKSSTLARAEASGHASSSPPVRLITPDEAIDRIGLLLLKQHEDVKRHLLRIAGIAIAGAIAVDGTAVEVENIDGLQEYVNCALLVDALQ